MREFPHRLNVHRGYLGSGKDILRFQYNPNEIDDDESVNWVEIQSLGVSYPILQYIGGKTRTVNFDIYVNGKAGDGGPAVVKEVDKVLSKFKPVPFAKQFVAPRPLIFGFGWFVHRCYLTDVKKKYTDFTNELQPLEATFSVSLNVIQS